MEQIEYIDIKDQSSDIRAFGTEASKAFRNLSMQITCVTKSLEQFVDAYNKIGCTSFNMTSDEIKTILDNQKNSQVRPATDEKSENPNQKPLFDFLEQNAYEEINSELLASFDSI